MSEELFLAGVLALLRTNEPPVEEAARSVSTEPREFLAAVDELLAPQ